MYVCVCARVCVHVCACVLHSKYPLAMCEWVTYNNVKRKQNNWSASLLGTSQNVLIDSTGVICTVVVAGWPSNAITQSSCRSVGGGDMSTCKVTIWPRIAGGRGWSEYLGRCRWGGRHFLGLGFQPEAGLILPNSRYHTQLGSQLRLKSYYFLCGLIFFQGKN